MDPLLGSHQAMQEWEVQTFSHVEVQMPLRRPRSCSTLLGTLFTAQGLTVSRPGYRRTSPTRPGTTSPARGPATPA
jgi:hypothetical protein